MGALHRLRHLVRQHGVRGAGVKLVGLALDAAFERRYGVDMADVPLAELKIDAASRERATSHYEPSRLMPLRAVLRLLKQLDPAGTLVDLGCGKGKVLLVAAECGMNRVRGVEFAHELCEIARANWRRFQAKTHSTCEAEIVEADVAAYPFRADETLFFVFNPFDESILAQMMANLAASARATPRRVFLAIAFPSERYRQALAAQSEFVFVRELVSWACPVAILSNIADVD